MNALFRRIEELTKELNALQPFTEENQKRLDKKFRLEFNYNSNHMEGNTLTYGETELLLIFDDTKGNHTLREYEEMKAHDVALKLIQDWAKNSAERPLIEQNIKNLNEIILVRPFWKDAIPLGGQSTRREIKIGDYKQFPNSVQLANGEMFEYASPSDTPILMGELMEWYRTELQKAELPPVALAALLHYKFVRIHPFDDGNGRLARLLMNYVLYCFDLPPVIIKSADKANYLRALNRADTGDLEAFVNYISGELEWSLELAIKAGRGESIEEEEDLRKEIELFKREVIGQPALIEEGTKHSILVALQDHIFPMFIQLENQINLFNDLFFGRERRLEFAWLNQSGTRLLGSDETRLESLIGGWLEKEKSSTNQKITTFECQFKLNGFKKVKNPKEYLVFIKVEFRQYNYIIRNAFSGYTVMVNYGYSFDSASVVKNLIERFLKELRKAKD